MIRAKQVKLFVIIIFAGIIMMSSCKKDAIDGSVNGTISIYDPEFPQNKTPIEGIKVFLVDTDFVVDSLDYSHNEAAVIDEAITNSDGEYLIAGIPFGNYAVVPIPDSIMHRFELENDEDSVMFSVREESLDYSLDFTAAEHKDFDDDFQIYLSIINRPNGGSISITRPVFLFNIFPTYSPVSIDGSFSSEAEEATLDLHFGIFGYLYVVSNNFKVSAFDSSGYFLFTRWISNNYFNTPEYAHWQINWSAQTITRK